MKIKIEIDLENTNTTWIARVKEEILNFCDRTKLNLEFDKRNYLENEIEYFLIDNFSLDLKKKFW